MFIKIETKSKETNSFHYLMVQDKEILFLEISMSDKGRHCQIQMQYDLCSTNVKTLIHYFDLPMCMFDKNLSTLRKFNCFKEGFL